MMTVQKLHTCSHSSSEASVVPVPTSTFGALLVFLSIKTYTYRQKRIREFGEEKWKNEQKNTRKVTAKYQVSCLHLSHGRVCVCVGFYGVGCAHEQVKL